MQRFPKMIFGWIGTLGQDLREIGGMQNEIEGQELIGLALKRSWRNNKCYKALLSSNLNLGITDNE